jgi:hypothetical protein
MSGTLPANQPFYWRVQTTNGSVTSEWSSVESFRTPASSDGGGGNDGGSGGGGGGGSGGSGAADELDLSQVTWLHHNVSSWSRTSTITGVSIGDPPICIEHTKSGAWPVVDAIEGNPWVFARVGGKWYAATYEWLRPGQECKQISAGSIGPHTKKPPLENWQPKSGETIGLMVSTPARSGPDGPKHERSNVVLVKWP